MRSSAELQARREALGKTVARSADGGHAELDELWKRLEKFNVDLPLTGLTFSERASKENAWSASYTRRVIAEYKRFLFLACRADHIACPSEAVDQIWHMHLTYTRSYWDELCKDVLRGPLHHGPTQGGSEEREKYYRLYERTLESYRHWFEEDPPSDIWPSADIRFGEDLHFVRVNTAKNWILPRPKWSRAAIGGASAGLFIPILGLAANPLNWTGPQFLALFFGLLLIATLVSYLLRQRLLTHQDPPFSKPGNNDDIGHLEAAWLQGGDQQVINCAVVDLAQVEAIALDGALIVPGTKLDQSVASPKVNRHRVSNLILGSVASSKAGKSWRAICRDANVGLVAMRQDLEQKGLATTYAQRASIMTGSVLLVGSVALLGAAKMWIGLQRGKPIGLLVLGEFLAIICLVVLISSIPRLTSAGAQLLARLKRDIKEHPEKFSAATSQDASANSEQAMGYDHTLIWSAALLGTGVLASTPLAEYDSFLQSQMQAQAGQAAASGCGATGCSGGGCGGGGCGGGGCGGCGS